MGKGLGYCDLGGGQAICEGDAGYCDKPDILKRQVLEREKNSGNGERSANREELHSRYKVLVVDDEQLMRKLVVALLSRHGHECVAACDGTEGLNKIYRSKYDAVITDIAMPGMDGITFTKKALDLYPNLPVMIITGLTEEYSPESALASGAQDFIRKPFSGEEFVVRFNKMMRDHEMITQKQNRLAEISLHSQKTA